MLRVGEPYHAEGPNNIYYFYASLKAVFQLSVHGYFIELLNAILSYHEAAIDLHARCSAGSLLAVTVQVGLPVRPCNQPVAAI
jgi:hypothetical protein